MTLLGDYGISVVFGPTQTICIERPRESGSCLIGMDDPGNTDVATVGCQIERTEVGSGIRYHQELGSLPPSFYRAIEETVYETLTQGLCGWEVMHCVVTLTQVGYSSPVTIAADFRKLTPLVVMEALQAAGAEVCEPFDELFLDVPDDALGAVFAALVQARAPLRTTNPHGASQRIICEVPTAEIRSLEQQLPPLTHGGGGWESLFARYVPVSGEAPSRPRSGPNPLNREHYFAEVARG